MVVRWRGGGQVLRRVRGGRERASRCQSAAAKQRALLALLALHRGQPVGGRPADRCLVGGRAIGEPGECPTGTDRPAAPHPRRGGHRHDEAGYALAVDPDDVDAVRFEHLVPRGGGSSTEGDVEAASVTLGEALGLRRGEPLAEFAYAGFADAERAHLDELTLVAFEAKPKRTWPWVATVRSSASWSRSAGNTHFASVCGSCSSLPCTETDGRPRPCGAYTEIRDRLVDELGIDPAWRLRELEARVLAQDPTLAATAPSPGPVAPAAPTMAGNLREQLSSFVGRDAELDELSETVAHLPARDIWSAPGESARPGWRWRRPPHCVEDTETAPGW